MSKAIIPFARPCVGPEEQPRSLVYWEGAVSLPLHSGMAEQEAHLVADLTCKVLNELDSQQSSN